MRGMGRWEVVAAVLVTVVAAARLTRLLVQDTFPPVRWLRDRWDVLTEGSTWNMLMHCHWCMGAWTTLLVGGSGLLSGFHTVWWVVAGWFAAMYVVSWLVHNDEGFVIVKEDG
jgi:carbon starvation protein CstA